MLMTYIPVFIIVQGELLQILQHDERLTMVVLTVVGILVQIHVTSKVYAALWFCIE